MRLKVAIIFYFLCLVHVAISKKKHECSRGSLNNLILNDLLAKAQINDECLAEARNAFKSKYNTKKLIIRGPFQEDESKAIRRLPDRFIVSNAKLVKQIFETFNELIRSVHISFQDISAADGKEIVKSFNDNLKESLTYLTIEHCKENVLDDLQNTFANVSVVKFSTSLPIGDDTVTDSAIPLSEIFPNLVVLVLERTRNSDWKIIGNKYPKLEYLSAESPVPEESNKADETHLVHLLKHSENISDLLLKEPSMVLLKAAQKFLPKLKIFSIKNLSPNYANFAEDISFDGVKLLTIHSNGTIPANILFDNLIRLDLHVDGEFTAKWVEFLESQIGSDVRKLGINMENVEIKNFLDIAETFAHLEAASINCKGREFSVAEILHFIKRLESVDVVDMAVLMDKSQHNKLKAKLSKGWKIASMKTSPHDETYLIDFKLERSEDEGDEHNGHHHHHHEHDDEDSGVNTIKHSPFIVLTISLIFVSIKMFQLN